MFCQETMEYHNFNWEKIENCHLVMALMLENIWKTYGSHGVSEGGCMVFMGIYGIYPLVNVDT